MKPRTTTSLMVLAILGNSTVAVHADSKNHLPTNAMVMDSDSDGITDLNDNCTLAANTDQRDTDSDGYGNLCDADLNNDLMVNAIDLGIFRSRFFTTDDDADFNGDGIVNATDLGIFGTLYFLPPGPSNIGILAAPTLSVSGTEGMLGNKFVDVDGNFALSWTSSVGATYYTVSLSINGIAQPDIGPIPTSQQLPISQNVNQNGDYEYRVKACNGNALCGPESASITVVVDILD